MNSCKKISRILNLALQTVLLLFALVVTLIPTLKLLNLTGTFLMSVLPHLLYLRIMIQVYCLQS